MLFLPVSRTFLRFCTTHVEWHALPGVDVYRMLIGASNPMLCPIDVVRLCGLTRDKCDFSPTQRAELAKWFREESVTKTWVRATSPKTNCSNSWTVPKHGGEAPSPLPDEDGSFPAYPTCAAGRPDHGSNGAYPSWPVRQLRHHFHDFSHTLQLQTGPRTPHVSVAS